MAASSINFPTLRSAIAARHFANVYLLHGEEGYYLDVLADMFEEILPPEERDFNLFTLYAPQVTPAAVVDACRRYPMMSEYQVVVLKEAQAVNANYLNALAPYAAEPNRSTILAIVCRGAKAKCAQLTKAINASGGVVFESEKIQDRYVGSVIKNFVTEKGLTIDDRALAMLHDYVGTDVSRIYNEVDKLTMILGSGAMITPESIEINIGFSKDYNPSEFTAALANRNAQLCFRCIEYFRRNPKDNSAPYIAVVVFRLFQQALTALYSKAQDDRTLFGLLGVHSSKQLNTVRTVLRNYNAWQLLEIISAIRDFEIKSKGISSRSDAYDLLYQLTFRILTTDGHQPVIR